jgi:hypothetical protein
MKAAYVKQLILEGVHDSIGCLGFTIVKRRDCLARKIPGGCQQLELPFYNYNPVYKFSLTILTRIDQVEYIYNKFSNVLRNWHKETNTLGVRLPQFMPEFRPGDLMPMQAETEQDIHNALCRLAPVLKERIIPFLEEHATNEDLEVCLNRAAPLDFTTSREARFKKGVILAHLCKKSDYEMIVQKYRNEIKFGKGVTESDVKLFEQLVDYLKLERSIDGPNEDKITDRSNAGGLKGGLQAQPEVRPWDYRRTQTEDWVRPDQEFDLSPLPTVSHGLGSPPGVESTRITKRGQSIENAIAYLVPNSLDQSSLPTFHLSAVDQPVITQLGYGMLVAYLLDEGERFLWVQENLESIAAKKLKVRDVGGFHAAFLDGVFEASLLLVDSLWDRQLKPLVSTSFVACAPSRDVLAFCDQNSNSGIVHLRQVIERVWPRGDHLLSQNLFERKAGRWTIGEGIEGSSGR